MAYFPHSSLVWRPRSEALRAARGKSLEFLDETYPAKTRRVGLPYSENFMIPTSTDFVWFTRVTDRRTVRRTYRRTDGRSNHICCRALKWIDLSLRQPRPKWSATHSYTRHCRIHFASGNIPFSLLWCCLPVCLSHTFRPLYIILQRGRKWDPLQGSALMLHLVRSPRKRGPRSPRASDFLENGKP